MGWVLNKNCLKYIENAYNSLSSEDKEKILASSDAIYFDNKTGEIAYKE